MTGGYVELKGGDIVELYVVSASDTSWAVQVETQWSLILVNPK